MKNYRGQKFRGGYRSNNRNDNFRRDRSRYRERKYSGNFSRNDREVVVVGQDWVQEPVLTDTELDVLGVGNMII